MDTKDTIYVCMYMRARPRPPAHAGDMNGFPPQTCPSVPPLRIPLEINTIAMGHLRGTLGFRDTSKWSEWVVLIIGCRVFVSIPPDCPFAGALPPCLADVFNRVFLSVELAQAVTDLVRGGICRDVLVALPRVETFALAGAASLDVLRDAGRSGQIGRHPVEVSAEGAENGVVGCRDVVGYSPLCCIWSR
jgi:hypothetical protein